MHKSRGKLSGVLHKGFKPDKCKTSLRMAMARIKLLRNRKEVAVRQMRREVAQLLEANQDQTARIRVEHVIREEKFMQAYDLIEVYCELIVARLSIIESQKTCPIDLKEAIASVIFASMRCADVTELEDVRKHFTSKYGKDFAAAALEVRPDSGVNRLVIEKLSAGAPDVQTKIKTLTSIAEEHNIKWEPKAFEEKLQKPNEDLLHGPTTYSGGNISTMGSTPSMSTPQPAYSSASPAAMDSGASHVPMGPYSPAGVSANNASLKENRRGSKASAPLSSQYSASTYNSAQIPGSDNFSHESAGDQNVSRPYSQYDASVPDSVSRDEEINQPRERKPLVSGANWHMEFKDATSAAQAAAESAEMASIAARAAAQLASRGNYSGEHSTGGFESGAYNHQNTPRKQTAAHSVKDEKRTFNDQSSCTNDPRIILSNEGKHSTGAKTSHPDSQNMSTDYSSSQGVHSYNSESHEYVYGMPVESSRAHSPEPPHSDDLYDRESNIGRQDHAMDFPGEPFQDAALGGCNFSDVNVNQVSSDRESTDDYYGNHSSSHGTFTHDGRTVWDNQTDKTQVNPSSAVFDQYDSDVEEENLFDTFASKHTEQLPGVHDNMESSNADWSQQHRNDFPNNHKTSDLSSRTETQKSDTLEANRRVIPSPRSYDNLPPTFDSDGDTSDEEIAARPTTMHAESLRSHSKGSTNSGKLARDVNESIEGYYESCSGKKSGTSSGLNVSYKEQLEIENSPRYDYSRAQAQRDFSLVQSRDSDISDEESEPEADKLKVSSSLKGNENTPLPFAQRTSATFDDKDEGDFGLNFSRLTPGLRNKPKQPPLYPKSPRENVHPMQSLNKAPASIKELVDSQEATRFKPIRSTMKNSRSNKTSSGGGYSSELYDRNSSVETPKEARSTMARNPFHPDDRENLSEQFGNANLIEAKGSEHRNPAKELYQHKPDIGGHRQMSPRIAKTFFDSDNSDEEVEQRNTLQSKLPAEQIPSRRTREVTSGAKRDGLVQTRAQFTDESESMPKETKVTQAFSSSNVEQRRDMPDASVPVQRPSTKTECNESLIARGKLQKAEIDTRSVPADENTETSAGTPKESTSKAAPAHVHPKLPTDYDSFAAHFKSLRTNRR